MHINASSDHRYVTYGIGAGRQHSDRMDLITTEVRDGWNKCLHSCLGINSDVEEFQAMVDVRNSYRIKILGSNSCLLGVGGKSMSRFSS